MLVHTVSTTAIWAYICYFKLELSTMEYDPTMIQHIWYKQNTDEYMSWEHDKKILKQKVQIDTNNKKSPTQNMICLKEIVTENIAWLPTRFI